MSKDNIAILKKFYDNARAEYDKILTIIAKYVKLMERAIISQSPDLYRESTDTLLRAQAAPTMRAESALEFAGDMFDCFANLNADITFLLQLINSKQFIEYRNAQISFNTIIVEETERRAATTLFNSIKAKIDIESPSQIFALFADLPEHTVATFVKSRKSTPLTTFLIINVAKTAHSSNVLSLIEQQKDAILNVPPRQSSPQFQSMLAQSIFIPCDINLTIGAFMQPSLPNNSIESIIAGIISSKTINLITIKNESPHALEYNLNGVISEQYINANKLRIKPNSGLSIQYIKKMTTIREIAPKNQNTFVPTIDCAITYHETNPRNKWLILRIMRGNYAIATTLSTINTAQKSTKRHMFDLAVPQNDAIGLIEGATMRPHQYNTSAKLNPIDPTAKHLLEEYERRGDLSQSAQPLKDKIHDQLLSHIARSPPIRAIHDFRFFDIDAAISATFNTIMNNAEIAQKEIKISQYIEINRITNDFTKRFRRELHIAKIDNNIFRDFDEQYIAKFFGKLFSNIIINILDTMEALQMFSHYQSSLKSWAITYRK